MFKKNGNQNRSLSNTFSLTAEPDWFTVTGSKSKTFGNMHRIRPEYNSEKEIKNLFVNSCNLYVNNFLRIKGIISAAW